MIPQTYLPKVFGVKLSDERISVDDDIREAWLRDPELLRYYQKLPYYCLGVRLTLLYSDLVDVMARFRAHL